MRHFRAAAIEPNGVVSDYLDFEYDMLDEYGTPQTRLTATIDAPGVYDWVREHVDGWVEIVPSAPEFALFCDEEGRLKDKHPNESFLDLVGTVVMVVEMPELSDAED